jgi:hypothetical protein
MMSVSAAMSTAQMRKVIEQAVLAEFRTLVRYAAPRAEEGSVMAAEALDVGGRVIASRYTTEDHVELDMDRVGDNPAAFDDWTATAAYRLVGGLDRLLSSVLKSYADGAEIVDFDKEAFDLVYEAPLISVHPMRGAVAGLYEVNVIQHLVVRSLDTSRIKLRRNVAA